MKKYDEEAKKSLIRALLEQPENLTVEEMRLSRKNARTLETLGITKLSGIVEQREDDLYTDMMDINENINGIDKLQIHNKVRRLGYAFGKPLYTQKPFIRRIFDRVGDKFVFKVEESNKVKEKK